MGIQCKCGRFLSKPRAVAATNEWGDWHLHDVLGDCSRCGPGSQATHEGDMAWWWNWDAWTWPCGRRMSGYEFEDDRELILVRRGDLRAALAAESVNAIVAPVYERLCSALCGPEATATLPNRQTED